MDFKVGQIRESKVWLDAAHMPAKVPLKLKITKVAKHGVYFRAFYGQHDDGSEWLGGVNYCDSAQLSKYLV